MCALVLALRKVPIYAPGGGGTPLGDPGNPTYSVAVSDEIAAAGRDKAAAAKESKRLVPTKVDTPSEEGGTSSSVDTRNLGSKTEAQALDALTSRNPLADAARDDWVSRDDVTLGSRDTSADESRTHDIEDLRQTLLKRESTRGRRRPGESIPPVPNASGAPALHITQASPSRAPAFDEEAETGIDQTMYGGSGFGTNPYATMPTEYQRPQPAANNVPARRSPSVNLNSNRI